MAGQPYARPMLRFLSAAALIAALVPPPLLGTLVLAAAPVPAVPDSDLRADLHCAAAFALAASEQARGTPAALALPALAERGKRFFADAGARAVEQGGMTQEAVRDLLVAEVAQIQRRLAADPGHALAAEVTPCLPRLDAAAPDAKSHD